MEKDKNRKKGKVKKVIKYVSFTVLAAFGIALVASPKLREKTVEILGKVGDNILGEKKKDDSPRNSQPEEGPKSEHPKKRWGGYYKNKPRYNNNKINNK